LTKNFNAKISTPKNFNAMSGAGLSGPPESTMNLHAAIACSTRFHRLHMANTEPRFEARPSAQFGQNWCVYVTWPSGKQNTLSGFETQHQALEWIKDKSANWVVEQILGDQT
jgi:hypothetical protein